MAKTNQRSIRYTDDVAEIVNKVEGNGFNEKFENLCIDYALTIPEREKMKAYLDREITRRQEKLKELKKQVSDMDTLVYQMQSLERSIKSINNSIDIAGLSENVTHKIPEQPGAATDNELQKKEWACEECTNEYTQDEAEKRNLVCSCGAELYFKENF